MTKNLYFDTKIMSSFICISIMYCICQITHKGDEISFYFHIYLTYTKHVCAESWLITLDDVRLHFAILKTNYGFSIKTTFYSKLYKITTFNKNFNLSYANPNGSQLYLYICLNCYLWLYTKVLVLLRAKNWLAMSSM